MKGKTAHTPSFGRIGERPVESIAQLRNFRTGTPGSAVIMGYKDVGGFGACKYKISALRMKCHPADMPGCQAFAGFFPRLSGVLGAKDAVFCSGKDCAFTGSDACNMLIFQAVQGFMPVLVFQLADHNSLLCR